MFLSLRSHPRPPTLLFLAGLLLLAAGSALAQAPDCVVADDGTGTVELPPPGCGYLSPMDVHMIIDGLPPGTTIELAPQHRAFLCPAGGCGMPGGNLGGEVESFESELVLQLRGTGRLDGFRRTLRLGLAAQTHTAPRNPGQAVQTFDTDMFQLQGALFGDPDFDFLQITGGTGFGLPSPGQTTLTRLPGGEFNVDSFFDITYQIDFVGAPGGALDGLSGSTQATIRMEARQDKRDSIEPDDGTGTVTLPPNGSEYLSPSDVHMIIDGLPPGTTIEVGPAHRDFLCPNNDCGQPGGGLGGEVESFDSTLLLRLTGTGSLAGFERVLEVPASVETHTGPRSPSQPVQRFDTEMFQLQGQILGDPDFDQLTVLAGQGAGLPPSPGHTTLTDLGDGNFQVDSFFDITYDIQFIGAPGGALDGLSGTTRGEVRVTACGRENPPDPCGGSSAFFCDGFASGDLSLWNRCSTGTCP